MDLTQTQTANCFYQNSSVSGRAGRALDEGSAHCINHQGGTMRILEITVAMLLVASNAGAFSGKDLNKLQVLNACENCDLSGAKLVGANLSGANFRNVDLSGANFSGADLSIAVLWNANTKGAVFCKTKTPWGVDNSGCKKAEIKVLP